LLAFDIVDYGCYTLEYDTDNGLYGTRFSITVPTEIDLNICATDNNFDQDKHFDNETSKLYPQIPTVTDGKYPTFNIN
jgi:hypothetical protein